VASVATPASVPATTSAQQTTESSADVGEATGSFLMPNEVGKVLQDAQDDIQRISGNPVYLTRSTDASGQGRFQVLDTKWHVRPECGGRTTGR
jgi:hypothetical protein